METPLKREMVLLFVILSSLIGICYGKAIYSGDNGMNITGADAFIDKLIEGWGPENDPRRAALFGYITQTNEKRLDLQLENGSLTGLRNLHRSDHCVKEQDGDLKVKAKMAVGPLNMEFDGTLVVTVFGPPRIETRSKFWVSGVLPYHEIEMEFTVNAKTGRSGKLQKFVNKTFDIEIFSLSGMEPEIVKERGKVAFNQTMEFEIQTNLKNLVWRQLDRFRFPVEDRQSICAA